VSTQDGLQRTSAWFAARPEESRAAAGALAGGQLDGKPVLPLQISAGSDIVAA
jgi:hypothetical protein